MEQGKLQCPQCKGKGQVYKDWDPDKGEIWGRCDLCQGTSQITAQELESYILRKKSPPGF